MHDIIEEQLRLHEWRFVASLRTGAREYTCSCGWGTDASAVGSPYRHVSNAVVNALRDAGWTIMSLDQMENELALAHQAGFSEGAEL